MDGPYIPANVFKLYNEGGKSPMIFDDISVLIHAIFKTIILKTQQWWLMMTVSSLMWSFIPRFSSAAKATFTSKSIDINGDDSEDDLYGPYPTDDERRMATSQDRHDAQLYAGVLLIMFFKKG